MSTLDHNPVSQNLQGMDWFKFDIKRAPSLSYFCQKIKIPTMSCNPAPQTTPYITIPKPGDHVLFEELHVGYKVDTNFQNWLEMYNWMAAINTPLGKGKVLKQLENTPSYTGFGITSDLTLYCLDSQKNPSLVIVFHDAFPTAVGGLDFDGMQTGNIDYVQAMASFSYSYFEPHLP